MELLQLKYFCAAAESENLSRVAKQYMVPVSNISQSIKRLEGELGVELFYHKGNKIELNEDGRSFYSYASRSLSLLGDAKEKLYDKGERLSGVVRIACVTNHGLVTRAILQFVKDHPEVEFVVTHSNNDGKFDIYISNKGPKEYGERLLLVDDTVCVMMNPNHPLAKKDEVTVSDLECERFVCHSPGGSMKDIATDLCLKAGFSPNFVIQTYDVSYVRHFVRAGLGIAIVPGTWRTHTGLVFKELPGVRRKTYAFTSDRGYTSRTVREFIAYLEKAAENQEQSGK